MTKKFTHNGKNYVLVTTKKDTGSNYNLFATIYEDKGKTPCTGTVYKQGTPTKVIMEQSIMTINSLRNQLAL
jgi:uncharacterized protein (UPF0128 family)